MTPESTILIVAAVTALAIARPFMNNPRTRALKQQRARLRQSLINRCR